ncbi:MAG: S-adenosylmethionine:tRNA ribosyltransferase-isomerase [Bacteroidales bacterium]|nr:S-adenosylmethionine:tRNA ribosyltransferase-isomerase [Bacteroidales bacterium]
MESIHIENYRYNLPEKYIAQYPLPNRENSKLLVLKNHSIVDDNFFNIHKYIPSNTLFFLNKTRVVKARLFFYKESGALIEIFCLDPVFPSSEINQAFSQTQRVIWKCLVGNAKKWKSGQLVKTFRSEQEEVKLTALMTEKAEGVYLIEFSWDNPLLSFADILELQGKTPLPPYINRDVETLDHIRYQTVYATENGSVAAPTAGLHFMPETFERIVKHHPEVRFEYLTLHVGAGTFKPVESDITKHVMHTENIIVSVDAIRKLCKQIDVGTILAVGTTSMRTLESLYWIGVNIITKKNTPFNIRQFQAYDEQDEISAKAALTALLEYMHKKKMNSVSAITSIMIMPGYRFRIVNQLLTNFHQPGSSLILLVAAFIGDQWKDVYQHAKNLNYRFLSYGDVCLFSHETDNIKT